MKFSFNQHYKIYCDTCYLFVLIVKMRNICDLMGRNHVYIPDIFNCYNCQFQWNVKRKKQEIQNILSYSNLKHACLNLG